MFPFKKNILKEIWEAYIFGKVNIKKTVYPVLKNCLLCHYYFWQMDWVWFHRTRELTLGFFFSKLEESLTEWHSGYSSFAWSWLQNRNLKALSRCKEKHCTINSQDWLLPNSKCKSLNKFLYEAEFFHLFSQNSLIWFFKCDFCLEGKTEQIHTSRVANNAY